MTWLKRSILPPGWLGSVSIAGLLLAITVAGLVGLAINARVRSVTDYALQYDIALEDRGDDFRIAVLDLRHYHRNLFFVGPSRHGLTDFEQAYVHLQEEIDMLAELPRVAPNILDPAQLRKDAELYYSEFRPAIDLYDVDTRAFNAASDLGLMRLAALGTTAEAIDRLGEQRAAASLHTVEAAVNSAQVVLLSVVGGLILVGIGFAYLVVRNLGEQKETALRLEKALRLKNDFVADASHELRTPLTVLRANADVALDLERNCVHAEFLQEIVQEAERMTRLVEDLLFLARSDAGSVPLDLEIVDMGEFLAQLAERANILAREHGKALHVELAAKGYAQVDRTRIEQAVLILVDNASKYSPADKPMVLRSTMEGTDIEIEVSDQGPGIPESDLALVFERFFRGDDSRRSRQGGAGLGLAIAKSIVELHGGRIVAESRRNAGTTMRVAIPLVVVQQTAIRQEVAELIADTQG